MRIVIGNVGRKNNLLTTFDADFDNNFFWKRKKINAPVEMQPNRILNGSDVGSWNASPYVDRKPFAVGEVFFPVIIATLMVAASWLHGLARAGVFLSLCDGHNAPDVTAANES